VVRCSERGSLRLAATDNDDDDNDDDDDDDELARSLARAMMPRGRHASRRNNRSVESHRITSSRTLVVASSLRYCHCRHRQRAIDHEDGDPRAAARVATRRENDRSRVTERDRERKRGSPVSVNESPNRC